MQKESSVRRILTPVLIALALICVIIVLSIFKRLGVFDDRYEYVREYADLLAKIGDVYIGEYDSRDVADAAMHASVDALGDRWSYYMTPDEYAAFLDNINNRFAGIGVGVVVDDEIGGMRVSFVYRGSPAESAGIIPGDVIIGIDGADVTGMDLDEMRSLLSRQLGDEIELTVFRESGTAENLTVVYSYVFMDPVSFEMIGYETGYEIGYIAISNFDAGAARSFISALVELDTQGAQAYIFDVRGNGGGRLFEMTQMLDYLLPEGDIFVAVDKLGVEDITRSGAESFDRPIVVLLDRYSYSAAEYFSAMLREYDRAELVGEQTTGKNRMQTTFDLPSGGALHISTSQYLTKNRVSLYDTGGVTPDHVVILDDEDFILFISGNLSLADDPQVSRALEILGDILSY